MKVTRLALRKQFSDTWQIVFYAALIAVAALISRLVVTPGAANGMLCGVLAGVFGHWRITARSSVRAERALTPYIANWLTNKGYIDGDRKGKMIPRLPRLLRFNSQDIEISTDNAQVTVRGPYYMLKGLAKSFGTI